MDTAFLHGTLFNIEKKRLELEQQNLTREEIKVWFESEYRSLSRKHAFTCICCNLPVNMNITNDDGRPFYFKHFDGKECSYSVNSKAYEKQVSTIENNSKKDVGLTLFKTILEGQLSTYGIKLERGYLYKKELSFIPDIILEFPKSNEKWAIDYLTSVGRDVATGTYARYLQKRIQTYEKEGFRSFGFIDKEWLAVNHDTKKGTLLNAEKELTRKEIEDYQWDEFLRKNIIGDLKDYFSTSLGTKLNSFDTRSIFYVDIENRKCQIIRMLEINQNENNLTFYQLAQIDIPLERGLTLNSLQDNFLLFHENEDNIRLDFLDSLIGEFEKFLKKQEEQQRLQLINQNQIHHQNIESITPKAWEFKDIQTNYFIDDNELEQQMQSIAKEAAKRPVDLSPNQWEWYQRKGHYYNNKKFEKHTTKQSNQEKEIPEEKRKIFLNKVLSAPIFGEVYIDSNTQSWRIFILKWIKKEQRENKLNVSLIELINDMKDAGIIFNQKNAIAKYPIKSFLDYYQKEIKKDLKMDITIEFIDD